MSKPSVAQILAAVVNREENKTLIIDMHEYSDVLNEYLTVEVSKDKNQIRLQVIDEKALNAMDVPILQETLVEKPKPYGLCSGLTSSGKDIN